MLLNATFVQNEEHTRTS